MTKKKKIIIGIFSISILLLLIGILTYFFCFKNGENGVETPIEPPEKLTHMLDIYRCDYGFLTAEYSEYCNAVDFQIPTLTQEPKVLNIQDDKFVLYFDKVLRIYNIETQEIQKIKLPYEATDYKLNLNEDKTKAVGVIYSSDDKNYGYYDIKKNKKMYENKYDMLMPLNDKYIQGSNGYYDEYDNTELFLLDTSKEKELKKETEALCKYYSESYTEKGTFYLLKGGCMEDYVIEIYDKKFNSLVKEKDYNFLYSINNNGKLHYYEDNKVKVYEPDGKIKKTYDIKGEVLDIFNDYYLVAIDDKLWIKDYNNYSKELGNWNSDCIYHKYLSGYYEENVLENYNEKAAGYYFIIGTYFESGGIEYYFNPVTKDSKSWILEEIAGYAKPVLYLYPQKTTEVRVTFEHPENLTTTYPKFNKEWVVTAKPNGDLNDINNKYYYGLYWEEAKNHEVSFNEGFYVTKDNAIEFLEEKLSTIGLNDKERNEFIMYWLPILEKNKQSVVYFELTEEREKYNKINITPEPDSLLRIAIHVKKVEKKVNIRKQKLPTFKREGFVAVEWGGVEYK